MKRTLATSNIDNNKGKEAESSKTKETKKAVQGGRQYAKELPHDGLLKQKHIDDLKAKGWTVVEGVLSPETCDKVKGQWHSTYESYKDTGFKGNDCTTWKGANLPSNIRGMQNWPPISQEPWVWETRLATAPVFAALWGVEESELISSMDRVCFVPPTRLKLNKKTEKGWLHIDQAKSSRRGTLECVQGLVSLNPIGEGEVALTVFSGAHNYHAEFFRTFADAGLASKDWLKFTEAHREWYLSKPGVKEERIHMVPGSLALWESRLPHHALPPRDNALRSNVTRYVIYSCMTPRSWADEKILKKRIAAFKAGRATSHWPQDGSVFAYKPRLYGKEKLLDPNFNPVERQLKVLRGKVSNYDLVRKLVGYGDDEVDQDDGDDEVQLKDGEEEDDM